MKCDNCRHCCYESASMDYPYPVMYCSIGHWDGDPGTERLQTKEDQEVDIWADCPDYEQKPPRRNLDKIK